MSPGLWILAGVLGGVALLVLLQARASRAAVGRAAPSLGPLGDAEGRLVWFHAPSCGPCRAMHPDIAALGARVIAVDVSQQPALAAQFGVVATPTTVRVKDGHILASRVGRLGRTQLVALLDR